ncbi:hypothetical protein SAMN06295970_104129 [Noviherbaspirillum suwonense]|uniref:Uncharacterized protein n=1 Tax=Noviherbaspirillum suwonense TaxID=1224511 RepID=A0ABY1Q094_9BURK|nr:hypothetical protein SAMN06295970_104129 [Noviherbaspirillum suwonense]
MARCRQQASGAQGRSFQRGNAAGGSREPDADLSPVCDAGVSGCTTPCHVARRRAALPVSTRPAVHLPAGPVASGGRKEGMPLAGTDERWTRSASPRAGKAFAYPDSWFDGGTAARRPGGSPRACAQPAGHSRNGLDAPGLNPGATHRRSAAVRQRGFTSRRYALPCPLHAYACRPAWRAPRCSSCPSSRSPVRLP